MNVADLQLTYASQALQQDFAKCFHGKSAGGRQGVPWELPSRKSVKLEESSTLFSQRYLSLVIDEGHLLRNIGPRHLAALGLGDQSLVRLILSATPIHTKSSVSAYLSVLCFIMS